jgi:hypothetical protein
MSGFTRYEFQSVWTMDATPADVYDALEELGDYPLWWPEVKEVVRIDDTRYRLRCRSLLPYDLRFVTEQARRDRDAGVLEAKMEGDLEGFSRWTISADGTGSRLVFDEVVITNKRMLNLLAPLARPAFKANHALMMRNGKRGLTAYLGGFRRGRSAG